MFGSHLSIAGSMSSALTMARTLGLDCVQVFTKNQQQWVAPPLRQEAIDEWFAERAKIGWPIDGAGPDRVVSHASYLANMGSPVDVLREKSIVMMREEVERCERLRIPILVFHPGAATGSPVEESQKRIAAAVARIVHETAGYTTTMCFENVAGAGTTLGRTFGELALLRTLAIDAGAPSERIGVCIDTCHAHAAGYDTSTRVGALATIEEALSTIGSGVIRALHVNDSKGIAGSHLDRHQHIGEGTIGLEGFAEWMRHPAFATIPKIMETPKGQTSEGVEFDTINVGRLRTLASGAIPTLERIDNTPSNVVKSAKNKEKLAKSAKATKPPAVAAGGKRKKAAAKRADADVLSKPIGSSESNSSRRSKQSGKSSKPGTKHKQSKAGQVGKRRARGA